VNRKAVKWIVPASLVLLALIAALTWWMLGNYYTEKAQIQLQETLRSLKLEDKVSWQRFNVSPLGVATFNEVRLEVQPKVYLVAKQLLLSDLMDKPEHQRMSLQLKQIETLFENEGGKRRALMYSVLPESVLTNPMDIKLKLDLNFSSNQAELIYESQQEKVADFSVKLNLTEIGALRGILGTLFPQSAAAFMELDPNFTGLNRLAAIYSISLNALETKVKDDGLVKQLTDDLMAQVENLPQNADNIEQAREQAMPTLVSNMQRSCHSGVAALMQPCQSLADFLLAKQNSLQLTAKPQKPVSLEQLNGVMGRGDIAAAIALLNIKLN